MISTFTSQKIVESGYILIGSIMTLGKTLRASIVGSAIGLKKTAIVEIGNIVQKFRLITIIDGKSRHGLIK